MKKLKIISLSFLMMLFLFCVSSVQAETLEKPGKPNLVSVKATGFDSVVVTWEKAENATYYGLYYKVDGSWVRVGKTEGTMLEHKSSARYPLMPGETYTYTVKAFNKNDVEQVQGLYDKVGKTIKLPKPVLPAVTNLAGDSLDYNKTKLTWDAVEGATGYRIYIMQDGKRVQVGYTTKTSYTYTASETKVPLTVGETYTYQVRPSVKYGEKSFPGTLHPTGVSIKCRPQKPVLVSGTVSGTNQVTIKWNSAIGASKYIIYYKKSPGYYGKLAEVDGSKTEYVHTSSSTYPLVDGKTYQYTVASFNTKGNITSKRSVTGVSVTLKSAKYIASEKVSKKAREVINRITTPSMSRSQKLNKCFTWVLVSHYIPNKNPDRTKANWEYDCALDFYNTYSGSCYAFACGFAGLARELGYTPYVIVIPRVHAFVKIDGGYWDNMHGGLRGVSTRPMSYTSSQIKLF